MSTRVRRFTAPQRSVAGVSGTGTPEETALESYFIMISKFNFEKARDQCDREREVRSASCGTNWCDFMTALSRLASAEALYWSLGFIERLRISKLNFGKKEPLRTVLDQILLDLRRVREVYSQGKGGTGFSWERKMTDLVGEVMTFVNARKQLMEFYVRLEHTSGSLIDYLWLERFLKDMHSSYKDTFQHTFLKPIKNSFVKEVDVLTDIVSSQLCVGNWKFMEAILALQSTHNRLAGWNGIIAVGHEVALFPVRHGARSSVAPPSLTHTPYLYKWLCKFHTSLLSKFSLYFHNVLSEHASVYDMRHLFSRLDYDYINGFVSIIRQTPAVCMCLIFNANDLRDFKGPEYRLPDSPTPLLTGLQSYPLIIAIPMEYPFVLHKPNVVSLMLERSEHLRTSVAMISQANEKLECMYFVGQVDQRVTLVIISSAMGLERNTKTIEAFHSVSSQLRNAHMIAHLRRS